MTKLEALAKDCIENHTHKLIDKPTKQDIYLREESIFIQGYRQSEKRITELEKENTELKSECRRCVYSDCPCILSDYGKDRNGICNHFKDVFDRNAELKEKLGDVQMQKAGEKSDLVWKLTTANEQKAEQLTKAKEIIRDFISVAIDYIDKEDKNYSFIVEAEQFLKDSEVEK